MDLSFPLFVIYDGGNLFLSLRTREETAAIGRRRPGDVQHEICWTGGAAILFFFSPFPCTQFSCPACQKRGSLN